jgi:hypothetical protein
MNRKDVSYVGIFTEHIDGVLGKDIPNQHITLAFHPDDAQFKELLKHVGQDCSYKVIGYANDGMNEGLQVVIATDVPYFGAEQQYITLSIDPSGKAVDTGKLDFQFNIPEHVGLHNGSILTGKIGVFTNERVVEYDKTKFEEFDRATNTIRDTAAKICISANMKPMISQSKDSAELSYRIGGEPWKAMGKNDANLLGTFNNVDVMIKDEHSTVIIEGAMLFQMDDALIIAGDIDGQGVCWSNVDFTDEYEKQCGETVKERDMEISDAAKIRGVGEDGIEINGDEIERE